MITIQESYNYLVGALEYLDPKKLELSNDDLEYYIFEELQGDATSFLHEWTVDRLISGNRIPENLKVAIFELRKRIFNVMNSTNSIEFYRKDIQWQEVRHEAMRILQEIKSYQNNNI
ncbi:MAG: hypothetical protein EOP53_04400 [Sphingobacteriales bacterium]|nr:MAG: hypothetical protein EOP53_04400 [Sphingobacteriales bacterium]